jgi:hypothetical protein
MKCPQCGSDVWDNRNKKINPKSPDWRCKNKACAFVKWDKPYTPPQEETTEPQAQEQPSNIDLGKKENNRLICRTDLMCTCITKYGEANLPDDVVNLFNMYWNEISK